MTDKKCPKCGARPSPHRAGFFMCDSKVFANGSFAEHITCLRRQLAHVEAEVALLDAVEGYADNCHDHGIVTLDVGVVRRILDRRERSSDGEAGKSV